MSLPTPDKIAPVVSAVIATTSQQVSLLGVPIDVGQVEALVQAMIFAICMTAWHKAIATGQAEAATITTEAQAEAAQRQP